MSESENNILRKIIFQFSCVFYWAPLLNMWGGKSLHVVVLFFGWVAICYTGLKRLLTTNIQFTFFFWCNSILIEICYLSRTSIIMMILIDFPNLPRNVCFFNLLRLVYDASVRSILSNLFAWVAEGFYEGEIFKKFCFSEIPWDFN